MSGHVYWSVDFASFYNFSIRFFHCFDRWYFFLSISSDIYLSDTGSSWSWLYGSLIYNCPTISKVGVRTPFMARCNRYSIMWYSLSVTCGRSVDFCLYSTNKTGSNDITDILLKLALSTINQTKQKLVCHNIIDITKISQLYYYLGYTIRNIMLQVSVHFNTQSLTCNSRWWLEHDKNQYALSQLMGF